MGVCLPSFGITAGASLFATKSSACFRIVGNPFSVIYSLSFFDRWKRLRKSDFASLSKRLVRSYSFLSEEMFSFNSSSGNNDGYMYFVIPLSVASYFQCYIHIRPLAVYIVGIEDFFASAFKNMAFATYLTIMQTSPFIQDVIQTFLSCR